MRYASIRKMDISNGEGIGVSLFTQGCHFHCKNCHNKEQWDFNGGYEYTKDTKNKILKLIEPSHITRFSILGGEPLESENLFELACLILSVKKKKPSIKIWLYTGWTYDELKKYKSLYLPYILNNIDVLVDGRFIEELKDITLKWRGSSNQNIYYLKEPQ